MYQRLGKRTIDVLACLLTAPLLLPVALVVAMFVRWNLGSPVVFRQQRAGWRGEPFELLKFRTMTNDRDEDDELLPDDLRLTRFGNFLRNSSLDELPQIINVLRGEMSLIGPRPLLTRYLDRYTPRQARRHEVRPGITGYTQVYGRNSLDWEEKFELDLRYVENVSLVTDASIMARTLQYLIRPSGVSAEGHATMPEFRGTAAQPPTKASPQS